jgi:hypothetical protein
VGCGEPDGADDALAATVEDTEDTTDDVTVRDVLTVPVGDAETTAVADGDGIETVVAEGDGELDEPTENEGESLASMDGESAADAVAQAVDFVVTEGDADVVSDGLDDDESSGDKDSRGLADRVDIKDAGCVASTETDAGFETKDDALGLPVVDALCDVDRDWEGDACPERDGRTLEVVSGDPVPSFDESALGEADGLLEVDVVLDAELETLAVCDALPDEASDVSPLAETVESSDGRGLGDAEADVAAERDSRGEPLAEDVTALVPVAASALPVVRALTAAELEGLASPEALALGSGDRDESRLGFVVAVGSALRDTERDSRDDCVTDELLVGDELARSERDALAAPVALCETIADADSE